MSDRHSWFGLGSLIALVALLLACSETPPAESTSARGTSTRVVTPPAPAASQDDTDAAPPAPAAQDSQVVDDGEDPCADGKEACFCPDGEQTGLQLCDAQGKLGKCRCAVALSAVPTAPTVGSGVVSACSSLEGAMGCDTRTYTSAELQSSLLFLVDRSGSMSCNPPPIQTSEECNMTPAAKDPTQLTRWDITVEAIQAGFEGLDGANVAAGLSFFSVNNSCGVNSSPTVPLAPISGPQLSTLEAALSADSLLPRGGTPLVGGTVLAYRHLHQDLKAKGNRYVILITDGEESCGDGFDSAESADSTAASIKAARDLLLDVEVGKARTANIRTFVIGAPGSEKARGYLSELAFLGGTAVSEDCVHGDPDGDTGDCHFDLTTTDDFATSLGEAIKEINSRAIGCEFPAPAGVVGNGDLHVQYRVGTDAAICLPEDDGDCGADADSWRFARKENGDVDITRIQLCGQACERVKEDDTVQLDAFLSCQIIN